MTHRLRRTFIFTLLVSITLGLSAKPSALVFQSDFGLGDGAVSAMQGVAYTVSPELDIFDLTHDIPPYDIWVAALTLDQTAHYWPEGTVFVSVVDPGVGTERKSVVLKTKTGHYFVTPDNGTLTFVAQSLGIAEVREIDEAINRRKDSTQSYTFHGRDVYAYTGARLASGVISFKEIGPKLEGILSIPYQAASFDPDTKSLRGTIFKLDGRYGNVWSNIPKDMFEQLDPAFGETFTITIHQGDKLIYTNSIPYCETFGSVPEGNPLLYLNSLLNLSLALNMDDFAAQHGISYGPDWRITISK